MSKIQSLIAPKTIAIVGASKELHTNSGRVMVNLQKSYFTGKVYLVNPNYKNISGYSCYPSLLDIEEEVDMACLVVPKENIEQVAEDCVKKNVKSVLVISSGFSEDGEEGIARENRLKEIFNGTNIVVYGPNSPGIFHFLEGWGISYSPRFQPKKFQKGSVGLISHGGSLGRAILDANEKGVGFSYWLSPGNELDININDCLEFLINDVSTETIILIIESISEEERLFRLLHQAYVKGKPIIFLPIGHTEVSREAVSHHLGNNNEYTIPWEIINHPGLIKVKSIDEIVAIAWLFYSYKEAKGKRTLIFSWAGATSIYLADICGKFNLPLPSLSNVLFEKICSITNLKKRFMNPLDLTTIVYDDLTKLTECLDAVHHSNEYDNIIVPFPFQVDYQNEVLAIHLKKLMNENKKIYIPIFMSQGYRTEVAIEILKKEKHPFFTNENTALKALSVFLTYYDIKKGEDQQNEKASNPV